MALIIALHQDGFVSSIVCAQGKAVGLAPPVPCWPISAIVKHIAVANEDKRSGAA